MPEEICDALKQNREQVASQAYFDICDVIKQNELELANTVCKTQPNKADSFFCFLLFVITRLSIRTEIFVFYRP